MQRSWITPRFFILCWENLKMCRDFMNCANIHGINVYKGNRACLKNHFYVCWLPFVLIFDTAQSIASPWLIVSTTCLNLAAFSFNFPIVASWSPAFHWDHFRRNFNKRRLFCFTPLFPENMTFRCCLCTVDCFYAWHLLFSSLLVQFPRLFSGHTANDAEICQVFG